MDLFFFSFFVNLFFFFLCEPVFFCFVDLFFFFGGFFFSLVDLFSFLFGWTCFFFITLRCTLTQSDLLGFRCADTSGSTRNYLKANWDEP